MVLVVFLVGLVFFLGVGVFGVLDDLDLEVFLWLVVIIIFFGLIWKRLFGFRRYLGCCICYIKICVKRLNLNWLLWRGIFFFCLF